jgi:hypothetical protein
LTATNANRWAIRPARLATGKSKLLVFAYCYHGSVDETLVIMVPGGRRVVRATRLRVDPTATSRVVEYNDLAAVERELAQDDVAAFLMESALTETVFANMTDTAESTGQRNEFCELLQWCHVAERRARTPIEAPLELPKVGGCVLRQVRSFGHVLTEQSVRVLV